MNENNKLQRDVVITEIKSIFEDMPMENLNVIKSLLSAFTNLNFEKSDRAALIRPGIINAFASSLLTDEERGSSFGLSPNARVRENAKIISPEKLRLGANTWVGEGAILDASGGLTIGSHTSIGPGVYIWSHSSHLSNLNLDGKISSQLIERMPTQIGDGVFIAGPSVVLPGSVIGNKCIVRPMSVVSGVVPDFSIVDGKQVKAGILTEELIEKMTAKLI